MYRYDKIQRKFWQIPAILWVYSRVSSFVCMPACLHTLLLLCRLVQYVTLAILNVVIFRCI